jgi:hypothetical protein
MHIMIATMNDGGGNRDHTHTRRCLDRFAMRITEHGWPVPCQHRRRDWSTP